jgi:hypothetical protein
MSSPARKAAAAKTKEMLKEMPLQELRQAHQMSQERLAEIFLTKQANVSHIERRTDMYISTLRSYIEAMGGKLDIIAKFPDGEVLDFATFLTSRSEGGARWFYYFFASQ